MSVTIRSISEEEYWIEALSLWNTCFPEDTSGFSDYYFQKRSSYNYVLALYEFNKMVSMLHMLPYPLELCGQIRNCRMVAGVATLKEYRNKGYAGLLLEKANELMLHAEVYAAVLQPFSTAYYAKFGYKPLSNVKECYCSNADTVSQDKLYVPSVEELISIYNKYKSRYNAMMYRDEAYFTLLLEEAKTEGGFILCNGSAYAKGWQSNNEAIICELVGVNESSMIAPLINKFGKLTARIPLDVNIPCENSVIKNFNMINVYSSKEVNDEDKLNYSLEYY